MNERILALRKALSLSQFAFGEKLGLSDAAISRFESGKREITEQTLKLICREFGVNEEWLRTGKGDMFNTPTDLFELLGYKAETMDKNTETLIRYFLLMDEEEKEMLMKFIKKIAGDLT